MPQCSPPLHHQPRNNQLSISEAEVEQFEEDGAIVLRKLIPLTWVEHLRVAVEENLKNPGPLCDEHVQPGQPGRFHDDMFLWLRNNIIRKFIFESHVGSIAKRMIRGNVVRLFYDHLLVKEPGTRTKTPWHNDQSYWPVKGGQGISIWIALDPIPESSCVQYIKGSHKWKLLHRISSFSGDKDRYKSNITDSLPDVPNIDERLHEINLKPAHWGLSQLELLKWEMQPGDCLVHHGFTIHGAPGVSAESGRRRGYATRWLDDRVTFDPQPGTLHHLWLKGGVDPALKPGDSMDSDIFPIIC